MFTTIIITPKGTNIGYNIKAVMKEITTASKIIYDTLNTTIDRVNKQYITEVTYTPIIK